MFITNSGFIPKQVEVEARGPETRDVLVSSDWNYATVARGDDVFYSQNLNKNYINDSQDSVDSK